ncbi:hypothetical protein [Bacillus sp. FJAT-49736]|uniref:hypothetical protein n=1 Tax=Bacillus sp. FJAT-49736 TaxID=2833582 RepID=UPI001BC91F4B|nr:hypothetical protein [Bacillus sp. FJAT-49736]MBS4174411.1 hypothetical protein [Bacillus sp. FJAT-49736]
MIIAAAFLPIIIVILFILGITVFFMRKRGKSFNSNKVKWTFIGYVVILVISVVFNEIFLVDKTNGKSLSPREMDMMSQRLFTNAIHGNLTKSENKFIAKKWEFPYSDNKLHLKVAREANQGGLIVIDRKLENDGKVEAVFYQTPVGVGTEEITSKLKPVQLDLAGNTLTLIEPNSLKFSFSKSKNEFTITQFNGEKWADQSPQSYLGQRLLYIKIPHDVNIVDESNLNIQYVGLTD